MRLVNQRPVISAALTPQMRFSRMSATASPDWIPRCCWAFTSPSWRPARPPSPPPTPQRRSWPPARTTQRHRQRQSALEHAQHQQRRAGRQGPVHHQFSGHLQCAAERRRDQRRQDGAGQPEAFLALQRGQHAWPISPRWRRAPPPPAASLPASTTASRPAWRRCSNIWAPPSFNNFNLQAAKPSDTATSTADHRLRRLHLCHQAAGHQRQSQQCRCRAFRRPTASPSRSRKAAPPPMSRSTCRRCRAR